MNDWNPNTSFISHLPDVPARNVSHWIHPTVHPLCTQMVPKWSGHSLPEIHKLSSKSPLWNLPWLPGLHILLLLTTKSIGVDLEVEVHHSSHPLWMLTIHWSVHVLLSCLFPWEGHSGRQGCRRGAKENHALSAASWSNSPVLDSAPNVAEKPFGLFYMSSPITSQSFDKSSFWSKL